jgi:hypothetical protein
MWDDDWAWLGLEPTTDLGAIKKAYAARLKTTRPDDDAEAYQALRGAYERAQQWAKWQREQAPPAEALTAEPAPPPALEPAPASAPAEPPPAATQAPNAEAAEPARDEPAAVHPRQLIDTLELRWRREGTAALLQAWPAVRRELDLQPLNRQAEFSAAFAHWTLQLPTLPDEFLKALDAHFGWLNDFRTERQLGSALTQALQAHLGERLYPAPVPEAVCELGDPLQRFHALQQAGGWWRLHLLLLLLQPTLARAQHLLGADWLRRLGLDLHAQQGLTRLVKRGQWLRVGAASALCLAAALALHGDPIIATAHLLGWLLGTGGVVLAALFVAMLVRVGPALTHGQRRLALPLERWRQHPVQPALGLAWLVFAAWLAWLADTSTTTPSAMAPTLSLLPDWLAAPAAWGFGIAGLAMAWPLAPLHGWVVAGLAPLVGALFTLALAPWVAPGTAVPLALAWMLLGAAVHEERVRAPGLAQWPLRPMLNSLALSQRWTFMVALTPLAVCSAYVALADGPVRPGTLFLTWVFAILGTAWLQGKADDWALGQLRRAT